MSGTYCLCCFKTDRELRERGEEHHGSKNGKMVIKHDCQPKCWNHENGIGSSDCSKTFQLNQAYADFLEEYRKNEGTRFIATSCPKCEIKVLEPQMKNLNCFKPEMQEKIKREYKELKKVITGKDEPDDNNRERERERAFWLISNSTKSNPLLYKVINF